MTPIYIFSFLPNMYDWCEKFEQDKCQKSAFYVGSKCFLPGT